MSPEQWGAAMRDGVAEVDGRADVYSLGVMAYEMVSGARPFAGTSAIELPRAARVGAAPPLARARGGGARGVRAGGGAGAGQGPRRTGRRARAQFVGELRAALGAGRDAGTPARCARHGEAPGARTEADVEGGSTGERGAGDGGIEARTGASRADEPAAGADALRRAGAARSPRCAALARARRGW